MQRHDNRIREDGRVIIALSSRVNHLLIIPKNLKVYSSCYVWNGSDTKKISVVSVSCNCGEKFYFTSKSTISMPIFSHGDFKKHAEVVGKRGQVLQKVAKRRAEIAKQQFKLGDLFKDLIAEMVEYIQLIDRDVDMMKRYQREKLADFDEKDMNKLLKKKQDFENEIKRYDVFKDQIKNLGQITERYSKDIDKEADLITSYSKNRIDWLKYDEELKDKIEKLESEKVRDRLQSKRDEIESEIGRKKNELLRQEDVVQNSRMDSIAEWRALKNVMDNMS